MNRNSFIKQKFLQFMQGRYGVDQLTHFLVGLALILAFVTMLVRVPGITIISWILIIIAYLRIFSKKINKRYAENRLFLDKTYGVRNVCAKMRYRLKYGKQTQHPYYIYKCRKCGQKIRIPKGKGRIMITCPTCQHKFKKNSK